MMCISEAYMKHTWTSEALKIDVIIAKLVEHITEVLKVREQVTHCGFFSPKGLIMIALEDNPFFHVSKK